MTQTAQPQSKLATYTDEAQIPTPALIVDIAKVQRNLDRAAAYCQSHGLKLRPHIKTHKSRRVAKMQADAGAVGLTVAKLGEAQVMADLTDDLLLAYPALDPYRSKGIAEIARDKTVHVAVDSIQACDVLAAAATEAGSVIGILVDIDTGFHRTGVQSAQASLEIAQHVAKTEGLRLDGIFCFPGHAGWKPELRDAECKAADEILHEAINLWKQNGLEAGIVSGGSTPTAMHAHMVSAYTEIRPGTYAYYDRNCFEGGLCDIDDAAARVVCTVVSDAVPGKVVIDAGSKTLFSDRLATDPDNGGFGYVVEYPNAKIVRLSEEHGEIDLSACDKKPKLGERLHVIPNHICPCVNLQERIWNRLPDGTYEEEVVDARGLIR